MTSFQETYFRKRLLLLRALFFDGGLGRCQTSHGHAVRRAGHVRKAHAVTELHRLRLTTVLTANAQLDVRTGLTTLRNRDLHELADAGLIERRKWFFLKISFSV